MTGNVARRLFGEATYIAIGQSIAALGAILGIRLLTEVLEPDLYGNLVIWLTAVALFQQCIFGPLSVAGQRFYSTSLETREGHNFLAALFRTIRYIVLGTCILVSIACLVGVAFQRSTELLLIVLAVSIALATGIGQTMDSIQNAARKRRLVAFHQALSPWLRISFAVLAIYIVGSSVGSAMAGYAVAAIFLCVSQCFWFRARGAELRNSATADSVRTAQVNNWYRLMLNYAWPIGCWGIFTWLFAVSDRWALGWYCDASDVGRYAVVYQLGFYPVVLLSDAAQQLLAPVFFKIAGGANHPARTQQIYRLQAKVLIAAVPVAIAAPLLSWMLSETVLAWFTTSDYRQAAWLLPYMSLAAVFQACAQLSCLSLICGEHTRALLPIKIGTSIIAISFFWIGVRGWGISGAAIGLTAAHFINFVWTLTVVIARCLVNRKASQIATDGQDFVFPTTAAA